MAVLVFGETQAVLRLKVAYVAWDEGLVRETFEVLAGCKELGASAPQALPVGAEDAEEDGGEDDEAVGGSAPLEGNDWLYTMDLAAGVDPPAKLPGVLLRAYPYGAVARDQDSEALTQALLACDAVVLVVQADEEEGLRAAVASFAKTLVGLVEVDNDPREVAFVLQLHRNKTERPMPQSSQALVGALSGLYADVLSQGPVGTIRRWAGQTPRLALEVVESVGREPTGFRDVVQRACRAALGSTRVAAYVAHATQE